MREKSKELEVAIHAALEAGKILEKYFETGIEREKKDQDASKVVESVTKVDRESEALIKKILSDNFPTHSIMGEETGLTDNQSEYIWYVDPVDGTTNYAHGLPLFGVSIALAHNNNLLTGVIYNPKTKELLYAEKGKGAYLNDRPIHVSKDDEKVGMMTTGTGRDKKDMEFTTDFTTTIRSKVRYVRILGCTIMELSYVARGSMEADIITGLSPHDFAAGALLVLEAGGKVTKHDGSPWQFPDNYFIASNGVFHDLLVEEIMRIKNLAPRT